MIAPKKFGVDPCGEGYVVVCLDSGRPLTGERSMRSANATAQNLNAAAAHGTKALSKALGATSEGD